MIDDVIAAACAQIGDAAVRPLVHSFFDEASCTATHVVSDPVTRTAAIIDSVRDFDAASGRTATRSADALIAHCRAAGLDIAWLLETHAHADHLSAAPYLKQQVGGAIAIGRAIGAVGRHFGTIFDLDAESCRADRVFDRLFDDGDRFALGGLAGMALHVPGHTPADVAYLIGDALFVGDTLFMPDYGTARADFPGGDARTLYRSIRRLLDLPGATRVFLCHDYKTPARAHYAWETTIEAERSNVHVHDGIDEDSFVRLRTDRDAALGVPRLLLLAIQVNLSAGRLPAPAANGVRYLKLPLDAF